MAEGIGMEKDKVGELCRVGEARGGSRGDLGGQDPAFWGTPKHHKEEKTSQVCTLIRCILVVYSYPACDIMMKSFHVSHCGVAQSLYRVFSNVHYRNIISKDNVSKMSE